MNKIQFDKKQLPQVIILGILSLGLFGYFGIKMLGPSSTQAAPPTASSPSVQGSTSATPAPTQLVLLDQPPGPGMHDPFEVPSDMDTQTTPPPPPRAPAPAPLAPVAPLPTLGALQPLAPKNAPVAQAVLRPAVLTPNWTFAGVIGSDGDANSKVAVLLRGDDHRYVRIGGWVDGDSKVVAIKSYAIVLCKDGKDYSIKLGVSPPPVDGPTPAAPTTPVPAGKAALPILPLSSVGIGA